MFEFIKLKNSVFPNATLSKQDFFHVPKWKRACIFVFLLRYLCLMKANRQWKKYLESDYKFNVRAFSRYCRVDRQIFDNTDAVNDLPDGYEGPRKRARKAETTEPSESASEKPRVRFQIDLTQDSTDDDESHTTSI